jgi:uncharacterized protein YfdQ (DUF2303 family)
MADPRNDFDAAFDAGLEAASPKDVAPGAVPYTVVPRDAELVTLEHLLATPLRMRAEPCFHTIEAFIAYVELFKVDGQSVIFGDPQTMTLHAIIDYHEPEQPAWREHHARYTAPKSVEWGLWTAHNGKVLDQTMFAQLLEDNLVDIVVPPGADILECCRSLRAKKDVEFVSAIDTTSGSRQFMYNQEVTGQAARRENLTMPKDFNLGIPVLLGGEAYAVVARLRFRIKDGHLVLWYDLYRPEYIERDAFKDVCERVKTKTGIEVWLGAA